MLINVGNFIRMLVRPTVTVGLVAGIIYAALSGQMDAAKELGVYTATAITFWFSDRNKPTDGSGN